MHSSTCTMLCSSPGPTPATTAVHNGGRHRRSPWRGWRHSCLRVVRSFSRGDQEQQQAPPAASDPQLRRDWRPLAGYLFACGAVTGTLLDGIHSRVGLQVYDLAPVQLGPLTTALTVPPLLGTFYVVLGALTWAADHWASSSSSDSSRPSSMAAATRAAQQRSVSFGYVALCYGLLAAQLQLSASLFEAGVPYPWVFAALGACAAANWWAFDRTLQGAVLGLVCALGAPAAELVLMAWLHVWHYSRPDVAGVFVSWVPWCYCFYTPSVCNLARHLWQRASAESRSVV